MLLSFQAFQATSSSLKLRAFNLLIFCVSSSVRGDKSLFYYQKTSHYQHSKLNIKLSNSIINQLCFPHRVETWDQKPIQPTNILTILQFGGGNMGTGESSHSSSQPLSISSSCWLWFEVSNLCAFSAFSCISVMAFWFLSS